MVWPGGEQGYGNGGQYPPPSGSGGYGGSGGHGSGGYGPGGYGSDGSGSGGYGPGGYGSGGYGGPGGFGGGGYGSPPGFPPPRRSSAGIIVAVIAVAVVLVGGGVAVAVAASSGHDKHPSASGSLGVPSSQPSGPSQSPPPESSPPPAQAKVPGWHAVVSTKHGVTYDVPPGTWSVKSPDTIVGFEDPKGNPEVAGSGAAIYKEGYCQGHSGSWRAEAAVSGYSTTDVAADAKDAARKWANFGYTPDSGGSAPTVTVGGTKAIDTGGGTQAQEATANVTVHDGGDPCSPPQGIVHAVAIPLRNGTVSVLVVIADQGVSDAAADGDLEKIAGSVRITA